MLPFFSDSSSAEKILKNDAYINLENYIYCLKYIRWPVLYHMMKVNAIRENNKNLIRPQEFVKE